MFAGATVWTSGARWGLPAVAYLLVLLALCSAGCTFDESGLEDKLDCRSSVDCGAGAVCIDGTCIERVGCIFNSDCPTGEVCLNATCVAEGDVDVDLGEPNDAGNADAAAGDAGDSGAGEPDAAFDTRQEPVVDADVAADPDIAADADVASDGATDPDVATDPDAAADLDMTTDPDVASDPDTSDGADGDADLDVVADPDIVEEPDLVEEEPEVPLVVPTFDDLPETAEDGALAEVEQLDNEQFRYSEVLGRWVLAWFYDADPVVDVTMSGSVLPREEESVPWTQRVGHGGTISVVDGSVAFDTSGDTDADNAKLARAFYVHEQAGQSHWFAGYFSVSASRGQGVFRHSVDARNLERAAVVNLATGEDGIRLAGGGDVSLGTVFRTETAETPRFVEVFLVAGQRCDLYVDHRLVQTVDYLDLLDSGQALYQVGDDSDSGGGLVTVRDANFGTFTAPPP